ncbi:MAG: sulfatase-like hydrolase/transferase [Opitutae bacterium]|nr:sulfatase-like hydrolase/transferase [Opitutae bacterium]
MRHKGTKAQRHRDFNRHIGAFLAAVAVAFIAPLNLPAKAPNVIMVLTDDQGYGDFSINGNPVIKTPNIDALGHGGVRFTDFHVAPMCTPTRSQLMTGLDAMQNGAMNVSSGRECVQGRGLRNRTFWQMAPG